jgi:hypothetical protein
MIGRTAEQIPAVGKWQHNVAELTTYELRDYQDDAVIAEQDGRVRIAHG